MPDAVYTALIGMYDCNNTKKTDAQILSEHEAERTKCTVYTRVMGYHRPVETFNAGKQGEFEERAHFIEPGYGEMSKWH